MIPYFTPCSFCRTSLTAKMNIVGLFRKLRELYLIFHIFGNACRIKIRFKVAINSYMESELSTYIRQFRMNGT